MKHTVTGVPSISGTRNKRVSSACLLGSTVTVPQLRGKRENVFAFFCFKSDSSYCTQTVVKVCLRL